MIDARFAGTTPRALRTVDSRRAGTGALLTSFALSTFVSTGLLACDKRSHETTRPPTQPTQPAPVDEAGDTGGSPTSAATTSPEVSANGTNGDAAASDPSVPPEPAAPKRLVDTDFAAAREKVCGVEWDKPAEYLYGVNDNRDEQHYVAGNEKALYAFEPHVRDLGGVYVGVGSDQGYVFVGWMKPELAVFVDYDREVVEVHALHQALIRAARDPEHLVFLWSSEGREEAKTVFDAAFSDPELATKRWRTYNKHRWVIHRRMSTMRKRHVANGVASLVSDPAVLADIKGLLDQGRICVIQGNLLEKGAVQALGAALAEVGLVVRGVYMSNAEEYWNYSKTFRENLHSLPFDDKSLVLRTIVTWEYNNDYRYNVQSAANYLSWLDQPWVRRVYQITPKRKLKEPVEALDVVVTDRAPSRDPVENWDY